MDGTTTHETGRGGSSPSLAKRTGKILAVRVQMLDDTITMFQIQVNQNDVDAAATQRGIKKKKFLAFPPSCVSTAREYM